jgi:glycosyltransferase involved in cell wall biosynthesis
MLVGIDASRAFSANPTGTETYSFEITSALLKARSPYRFRLYTRKTPPPGSCPPQINYDIHSLSFPRLWTHVRLSAEMISYPPDVLFVPSHVLPLVHPQTSLVTVHDLGYLHFPQAHRGLDRWYLDLSTRWNARNAMRVFVDSNATSLDLVHFYGIDPSKIHVVYPAVGGDLFHTGVSAKEIAKVVNRYHIQDDYLISVGTVHPRKNYERLIQAFQTLPEKYQLVIVGKEGWRYREIRSTLDRLNLASRVKFLDYVGAADLPALYSGARLSVFPSLYEGFGFPILEAQSCGTPVVCSNTSSLPEVAGDAAAFFDPLDVDSISGAINNVVRDELLRANLIAKGRANVTRFSWGNAADEILKTIASL